MGSAKSFHGLDLPGGPDLTVGVVHPDPDPSTQGKGSAEQPLSGYAGGDRAALKVEK